MDASVADLPEGLLLPSSYPPTNPSASLRGTTGASSTKCEIKRFNNLKKLSMGVSNIRDEGAVALFLSHLCPIGCEIECGVTWTADLTDITQESNTTNTTNAAELNAEILKRCTKWEEVGRMLPLLTRLRMEERDRCKALGDEVEDLRIRNRILMERWKKGMGMGRDGSCIVA